MNDNKKVIHEGSELTVNGDSKAEFRSAEAIENSTTLTANDELTKIATQMETNQEDK